LKFWNFIKNDETPDEVELRIEGEIVDDETAWLYEWFGVTATSPNNFKTALSEHSGKNITVWVDSFGGDVLAGTGIYNALKEHKGKVTVKIDGKAMSAASVIAMAGSEILMSPGSLMMIHNPWSGAQGEAKDMRHTADVLDQVKDAIVNTYQLKTRRSRNKISEMMDNETWMSAKTAISEGFADGMLYTETKDGAPVENSMMFSRVAVQNSISVSMKETLEKIKVLKPELFENNHASPPDPCKKNPEDIRGLPVDLYQTQIILNRRKANV